MSTSSTSLIFTPSHKLLSFPIAYNSHSATAGEQGLEADAKYSGKFSLFDRFQGLIRRLRLMSSLSFSMEAPGHYHCDMIMPDKTPPRMLRGIKTDLPVLPAGNDVILQEHLEQERTIIGLWNTTVSKDGGNSALVVKAYTATRLPRWMWGIPDHNGDADRHNRHSQLQM